MKKILSLLALLLVTFTLAGCDGGGKSNDYNYNKNYTYLDNDEYVFEKIGYDTLMNLFNKKGTIVVYFGGAWCPNCQAAVPYMNRIALLKGIDTIYNFDVRTDESDRNTDIRKCLDATALKQYSSIVKKIGYVNPDGVVVTNDEGNVLDSEGNTIARMSVPTLMVIKNGKVLDFVTKEEVWDVTLSYEDQLFASDLINLYSALLDKVE